MKKLLLNWLVGAVAIYAAASLLPWIEVTNFWAAIFFAGVLGLLNALIKPFLTLISMPFIFLTLGLFMVIVNGLMMWMADAFVQQVHIGGFWRSVAAGIVVSILTWIINALLGRNKEEQTTHQQRPRN